ncbi:MAG: M56 family metallopeptidase [Pseudomonadota bacterium]
MSAFLFDTLLWTAVLIAVVLVLRRPVTKAFGAPMAYALWALPMLRLLLPPIELPAWLAPAEPMAKIEEAKAHEAEMFVQITTDATAASPAGSVVVQQSGWDAAFAALPLTELALALWLGGAAVFLYLRFSAYFRLRDELTVDAREVGTAKRSFGGPFGTIRLIETPGTTAPLAFGVLKPVIALPPGFMARVDRDARDLALEHELEHHRGHDLLINVLVQPLFALHWFNPLGRYGWLALRRDQEAACDARVIASRPQETRALYANVIASFAAGPNVALAAPMACPVLGDKSIIQRLRNLKMTEQSSNTKSRKVASRLMLGTAVLALPLTASITYAESLAPEPPAPPAVAYVAPKAPLPPSAPMVTPLSVQVAPEAPTPPEPPTPGQTSTTIITVDPDTGETKTIETLGQFNVEADEVKVVKVKDKEVVVFRDVDKSSSQDGQTRYEKIKIVNRGNKLSEAEMEEIMVEVREGLAEADEALTEVRVQLTELEKSEMFEELAELQRNVEGRTVRTVVRMECDGNSKDVATTSTLDDGSTKVMICESRIMAHALTGLEQARAAIAENAGMDDEMREKVLAEIDQQIADWKKDAR